LEKFVSFLKKETVFSIAFVLAVVSCFFVKPSAEYLGYINWRTLALLLVMMTLVQLLKALDIFDLLVGRLLARVSSVRGLVFVLVYGCFFASMLITNDVSLLTMVPFAIVAFKKISKESLIIPVVILQTIAANMGSMLLPIGSPHNIVMYGLSGMSWFTFVMTLLPYWIVSFTMLLILCFLMPSSPVDSAMAVEVSVDRKGLWKKVFSGIDWFLLLTFVTFFVLIGNLKSMPAINSFFTSFFLGRELLCSILACQIISNVPTAMMLSGFSTNISDILIGINIGGLGTLIASMANLISYKTYAHEFNATKGRYLLYFTLANIAFLMPLVLVHLIV